MTPNPPYTPPPTRFKRFVRHPLEAFAVYLLYGFFRLLPVETASALGGWIGRTVGPRLGASKKVRHNITRAMPEVPPHDVEEIICGMWDNLGRVMAEYPHLDAIAPARVEIIGREILEQLVRDRKPALIVSGHFANWEIIPVTAIKMGLDVQLVYRHANNPYVNKLLAHARRAIGNNLVRKGTEGARSIHRAIKQGRMVGLLVDQKDNRGQPIPFFGRPAMTSTASALLALHHNVPVVMVNLERVCNASARFRMTIHPPLSMPDASLPREEAVTDLLTRINLQLEAWVRDNPAQWLWLHRRWGRSDVGGNR